MQIQSLDIQDSRLATLYQVSSQLGRSLNLDDVLAQVMDSIIELTGAERGYIVVRNEATQQLETAVARNVDHQSIPAKELEISETIIKQTIETAQGVLTNNAQNDERFSKQQSIVKYQLRSIMSAPLQVRNKVFGAVYIDNPYLNGVFKADDHNVLLTFANQAAVAIENARLFTQTDQALARRVEELSLFQKIDEQLNQSLELKAVLQTVLKWAISSTQAENGSIGLVKTDEETKTQHLQIEVSQGYIRKTHQISLDHPLLTKLASQQKPIKIKANAIEQTGDSQPVAEQLIVPLIQSGELNGIITLACHQEGAFQDEDEQFVIRLASKAAVALQNAQLYEDVKKATKAKSDFISLVSHELRLPMTSIKGYTDLLITGMTGPLNEQQSEFLQVIKRNLTRMNTLISDLANINRIESGRLQLELAEIDVGQAINDVVDSFRKPVEEKGQSIVIDIADDLETIYADQNRVGQILTNLVSNAHKYSDEGDSILIKARQLNDAQAQIAIIDTGFGISEDDQARLFSQFFRSEQAEIRAQAGWGLGLSIVKYLVEAQDGKIDCQSILGEGSTFTFTLPCPSPIL